MKLFKLMLSLFVLVVALFQMASSSICCEDIKSEVEEKELAYGNVCSTTISELVKCCERLGTYVEEQRKAYETLCPELDEFHEFHANFTTLGASGRLGPTSLGSYYDGKDNENMVILQDGIQFWTVPYTGAYEITAVGAAGGYDPLSQSFARGRGAYMRGDFAFKKGDVIKVLVGQQSFSYSESANAYSEGGGGGSFVATLSNTPLIVAGGGGGGQYLDLRLANCDASTGTSGKQDQCKYTCSIWSGGVNGSGALEAGSSGSGGGGGGFYTNGRSGENFGGAFGEGGEGGRAFIEGGVGGRAFKAINAVGGFGGGGGANGAGGGAGGGGGYSGGASGDHVGQSCGGGGGSYNVGKNQENKEGFWASGGGYVEIRRLPNLP